MRRTLFITALLICPWPTATFAGDPSAPGDYSKKATATSRPAEAAEAKIKAFIHPETGEILTYEQWQQLDIENDKAAAVFQPSSDTPELRNPPTVLQGRQVDLGNGDYVIVVDIPESEMIETKAWFDKEGKAHIRCNH